MAKLGALKRSMAITIALVFSILFALVMTIAFFLAIPFIGVLVIIILFLLLQWAVSPAIVAWSTHLHYLRPGENLFLEQIVYELCQRGQLKMPRLATVNDPTPNAFVFGRTASSATLAVHRGLLERLTREEIRAVIGHELGHLKHKDVTVMTFASAIPLIAFIIARSFLWGASGSRKNAGAIIIVALVSWVIYFVSQLLVLYLSRLREFYADSYSAALTGEPHSLSSALAKITYGLSLSQKEKHGARAFYIGDEEGARREIGIIMQKRSQYDLDGNGVLDERELELAMESEARSSAWGRANHLLATHPPTFKRILVLKEMERDLKAGNVPEDIYKYV